MATRYKLSETQKIILRNIARGDDPFRGCHGRSQHGGWNRSYTSLCIHGFVDAHGKDLTEAGVEAAIISSDKETL